jgi:hypothetical protein
VRLHIEVTDALAEVGGRGWSAWVDEVHADDRRTCHTVVHRGDLRAALTECIEVVVRVGEGREIDELRRRNAELEVRLAEAETFVQPGYHLSAHVFVDGRCGCGAFDPIVAQARA